MSATATKPDDVGLKLDDKGRLLPLTDDERKARVEGIKRMFAEWDDQPDDDPPGIDFEAYARDRRKSSRTSLVQRDVLNMARIVILDSGPLGLLCSRNGIPLGDACRDLMSVWNRPERGSPFPPSSITRSVANGFGGTPSPWLRNLDKIKRRFGIPGLDDDVMELAARFWADAHRAGKPTDDPHALDADCLLAAQASLVGQPGDVVTIATSNVGHLNRFPGIDAREWASIAY